MATENEELRLTVTLVDNASQQIERIKNQLAGLGGGQASASMEKLKRQGGELGETVRTLGERFGASESAALGMARAAGLVVGGLAAVGIAAQRELRTLRDFSEQMVRLRDVSQQTGVSAGQIRALTELLAQVGVGVGQAHTAIASMSSAMVDLQKRHSELRQDLLKGFFPGSQSQQSMVDFIDRMQSLPKTSAGIVEGLELVRQKAQDIYEGNLACTATSSVPPRLGNRSWKNSARPRRC